MAECVKFPVRTLPRLEPTEGSEVTHARDRERGLWRKKYPCVPVLRLSFLQGQFPWAPHSLHHPVYTSKYQKSFFMWTTWHSPQSVNSATLQLRTPRIRHSHFSHTTEILLFNFKTISCQSQVLEFFWLLLFQHCFVKCLCSLCLSQSLTLLTEVQLGLKGLFCSTQLSPMNHRGSWTFGVSFLLAAEQLNILFCPPE